MHARPSYACGLELSPSGEWLAFRENFHVYVYSDAPGGTLDLSLEDQVGPHAPCRRYRRRLFQLGRWRHADMDAGFGAVSRRHAELFAQPPNGAEQPPVYGQRVADLSTRPADKPTGTVALTGARIVTMNGGQVIENGMIVVHDNRIVAVGAVNARADSSGCAAAGSRGQDGDARNHRHARARPAGRGRHHSSAELVGALASRLGVTTVHDPSNQATEIFAAAEYQRAGICSRRVSSRLATWFMARDPKALRASRSSKTRAITFNG